MKAVTYHHYGTPDNLKLGEIAAPHPKDNEVLIKVKAASINSWDWDLLRGRPYIVRMWGLFKPGLNVLGADVAGVVAEVGKSVTAFRPGDEVFGDLCECGWGGFAEYTCAPEKALALKSPKLSFEEAASLPQAGTMAMQCIYDDGRLKKGQQVLINGAGGGVGTLAIQMAKSLGAEVTVVDSQEKLESLRSLGADHVIDYRTEDFATSGKRYDLIVDVVANRSLTTYKHALNSNGTFLMVGGTGSSIIQAMALGPLYSRISKKRLAILVHKPNKNLLFLNQLVEKGVIKPVIDRCYPLEETSAAFRYFSGGKNVKGKVIVTVNN